jgi:iron complex outermembrane receptor protein
MLVATRGRPSVRALTRSVSAIFGIGIAATPSWTWAQSAQVQDVVVTTGSRGTGVTVTDSPSPIDVIDGDQLQRTGKASLREILGALSPSLTAPAQPGGGTSASVRPFKILGLSGDEVLVLVNGKRRHNTAVYNNFGTGSVPVDLDLIPISAIDHIEVLRDGAAAQYGSDAIAAVINIILKRNAEGGSVVTTAGQQQDKPGDLFQQSFNLGQRLGQDGGFVNISGDLRLQGPSYSAGNAQGSFYFPLLNGKPVPYGTPGATPDPRDATVNRLLAQGTGRSDRDKVIDTSYNAELPVDATLSLYSFSTFSYRDVVDTRGTFRPNSVSSLPEVYPNGFAAQRLIHEPDYQVAAGAKGLLQGWNWDLSSTYGHDAASLGAQNTLNASLGPTSPTSFYLGVLKFDQLTSNLDLTRAFDLGLAKPAQVSWGFEHRWEQYTEGAGEPDSYIDGGYVIPAGQPRAGQRPPAGLQSFVGNTPADASSKSRDSYATYLDVGTDLTARLYASAAVRLEHYDDSSGNTASGKLSTRFTLVPGVALRGTLSNGFRAPSLAQQIFSVTQSTSVLQADGSYQTLLAAYLPTTSPLAQALGAKPLTPEKSTNLSLGLAFEPNRSTHLTVDFYQIQLRDMIVKGEILQDTGNSTLVRDKLASLGFSDLYAAQYNLNAADALVRGVDIASDLTQDYKRWGIVKWSAVYSYNHIDIDRIAPNPAALNFLGSTYIVFGRQAQLQLTESNPRDKLVLGANWLVDKLTTNVHVTRYGKYVEPGTTAAGDLDFSPKWVTDLDVAYQLTPKLSIAIGANNLFGIRPDNHPVTPIVDASLPGGTRLDASNNYGQFAPFSPNGGFYYARLAYEF